MTTWARRAAALLVAAALLGSGGCLWVAAGAAAGAAAAGYAYLSAPVYREYPASPTDTGKAVETALAEMQLTLVHKETTGDGLAFEAFSCEYILNILEARSRALPEPGPLQLTRRHDLLEIDIDPPDLNAYEVDHE